MKLSTWRIIRKLSLFGIIFLLVGIFRGLENWRVLGRFPDDLFGWSLILAGLILIPISIMSFYKITNLLEEQQKKKNVSIN